LLSGCQTKSRPADQSIAQQSIEKMLETWKSGGKATDLKVATPSIIAVDDDWERNVVLNDYRVETNPFNDGVNLHFTVGLTLKNKQGKEVKKEQVYIVGTNPVITIFRK
jgi:hypothetical protein